jgi:hypothetical protein
MTTILKNLLRITAPTLLITLLVLEITFRLIIPASNPPMAWFDDENQIYRLARHHDIGLATIGVFAQQRARWHINNAGWNSPVDYTPVKTKPRIAVIGDSYIESLQVDVDKNFPSVLRGLIGDAEYEIYSFGISGAPLSQYLHMGRYVIQQFDPDLMIFNVVHNDFAESVYRINHADQYWLLIKTGKGEVEEVRPRAAPWTTQFSPLKQVLRHSALLRYIMFNLGIGTLFDQDAPERAEYIANINPDQIARDRNDIGEAVRYILGRMQIEFKGRQILFVMDAPRDMVYAGQWNEQIEFLHKLMADSCRKAGFALLDLTKAMRAAYAENGRHFESQWDGHWNEYGHEFVARTVARMLHEGHFL